MAPVPGRRFRGERGGTLTYLAIGYPFGPILFSGALAVGGLAARRPLRTVALAGLVDLVGAGVAIAYSLATTEPAIDAGLTGIVVLLAWAGVWLGLPCVIGIAVRVRGEAAERVQADQAKAAASHPHLHRLTDREREIAAWVATGRSNDEIAEAPGRQRRDRPHAREPRHAETRRPRPRPAGRLRRPVRPHRR